MRNFAATSHFSLVFFLHRSARPSCMSRAGTHGSMSRLSMDRSGELLKCCFNSTVVVRAAPLDTDQIPLLFRALLRCAILGLLIVSLGWLECFVIQYIDVTSMRLRAYVVFFSFLFFSLSWFRLIWASRVSFDGCRATIILLYLCYLLLVKRAALGVAGPAAAGGGAS